MSRVALVIGGWTAAAAAFAAPGSIIASFALAGQPAQGVRGLAYDWTDENIWAAGVNGAYDVRVAKFDKVTRSVLTSWTNLSGAYWQYDLGYGYRVGPNRYFVATDQYFPRLRLYTTAGSYYGSMPDPFTLGYDTGAACDWGGTYVYVTNYDSAEIFRWGGTAWAGWVQLPATPPMGVGVGWGRVFVVTASPDYKIYMFNQLTGSLVAEITLSGWSGRRPVGLSLGRVDAAAAEESVFIAVYSPAALIYEVSVGNLTANAAEPASLGKIKSIYR